MNRVAIVAMRFFYIEEHTNMSAAKKTIFTSLTVLTVWEFFLKPQLNKVFKQES